MIDVTIVSEDAERLARVGGVLNQPERPWDEAVSTPFTALLYEDLHCTDNHSCVRRHGTVTVTGVHHADDCNGPCNHWWSQTGECEHCGATEPEHCHPDAKPDMWHWIVEPAKVMA